jgi:ethanolamine permease
VLGYAAALAIHLAGQKSVVGAVLLNMAVFGAVIAYVLQMASFIRLRMRFWNIARPWRSPAGVAGAVVAGAIALITLAALFVNRDYRPGVVGAAIWFVAGIAWCALVGRKRLVLAPEERFAEEAWANTATPSDNPSTALRI